ncbi:MAG: COX15/CtaA family protein [Alphaproteobacteria bacterium]|nr:COX15/CtaA family protein [Alphaproteobacteria bacterium]
MRNKIALWLFICCFLVAGMVVVGGLTRLTDSGLSITEWKPVTGALPPLSDESWQREFAGYQQSPEYHKVNHGMSLEEFKGIFWLEYIHRLLGRVTCAVFLLPLLYFIATKQVTRLLALRLAGIFLLGGLQGAMGWYMVKSGLVDRPDVSQYRLTAHLLIAFAIFALLFWTGLAQSVVGGRWPVAGKLKWGAAGILVLILLQVAMGGFVAGLDAGLIYNTYPTMNSQWIPDGLFAMQPWWTNIFEDVTSVQFIHRWLAMGVAAAIIAFCWSARRTVLDENLKMACNLLLLALITQIGLGIATLLHSVPLLLASLHQACALALFAVALYISFRLWRDGRTD